MAAKNLKYNRRQERAIAKARERMRKRNPKASDEQVEQMAHEYVFNTEHFDE